MSSWPFHHRNTAVRQERQRLRQAHVLGSCFHTISPLGKTPVIIEEKTERPEALLGTLLPVWESSVAATHDFLSNQDIIMLRPAVLDGLRKIPVLLVAEENGNPVGFLGMDGDKVEMLFVDAENRGMGTGGALLREALFRGARRVDVNEQNPQAVRFYLHMGFAVAGRSKTDALGLPFPILHMRLV